MDAAIMAADPRAKLGKAIGRRLMERRERLELNRLRTAQAAGITWANLQLYEQGRKVPDVATLIKLAGALGLSVGRLLQGIEREI